MNACIIGAYQDRGGNHRASSQEQRQRLNVIFKYFMSILSPNAEEIEALASREEVKEIQFSESPDRTALETWISTPRRWIRT